MRLQRKVILQPLMSSQAPGTAIFNVSAPEPHTRPAARHHGNFVACQRARQALPPRKKPVHQPRELSMTLRYAHGIRHDQHATFVACARAGVRAGVLCMCVCVCVCCVYIGVCTNLLARVVPSCPGFRQILKFQVSPHSSPLSFVSGDLSPRL